MFKKYGRKAKISLIIMILFVVISAFNTVNAASLLQTMETQAGQFIENGHKQAGKIKYDNIANEFAGLGQILTMVGAGVMVAVTTYMGIKYLTAGPEAQAKLKTQLIGVVVSGVVIFGAYGIWKLVIEIASQF